MAFGGVAASNSATDEELIEPLLIAVALFLCATMAAAAELMPVPSGHLCPMGVYSSIDQLIWAMCGVISTAVMN